MFVVEEVDERDVIKLLVGVVLDFDLFVWGCLDDNVFGGLVFMILMVFVFVYFY